VKYFEAKPQVTVFFKETAGKSEAETLKAALEATGKTAAVTYVSKEQALEIYKEQNKNDPLLLEMVSADILPASLEVSAKDPRFLKELEPTMRGGQGVEEVVYQKDVIDALLSWTNAIRLVGGVLAGLLSLLSMLVIMTIIGMKVALKKEEVEILALIGASSWYIRFPFLLEAGFYGAIGASLAWFVITVILLWFRVSIVSFFGVIPTLNAVFANPLSSVFLLSELGFLIVLSSLGFLLGAAGSAIALTKYLKF
jgi:cell division transport system permease protein